jgi:NADPH:quinone reductase-like Zn-dependent oxidoreductase
MRRWYVPAGCQAADQLHLVEGPMPEPGPGEVLVRFKACSLNYRDQMIAKGVYFGGPLAEGGTPLSDGAGVIAAVGPDVVSIMSSRSAVRAHWRNRCRAIPTRCR